MVDSVLVSAPGKLYLFGEHAVMHGQPSMALALDKRMYVKAEKHLEDSCLLVSAADIGFTNYRAPLSALDKDRTKELRFVMSAARNFYESYGLHDGVNLTIESKLGAGASLGSSAAVTVACIEALATLFEININKSELFELSYKAHTIQVQRGAGSGYDIATAVYGGVLYFKKGGEIIKLVDESKLPLIYASTDARFDTPKMVRQVNSLADKHPKAIQHIWASIGELVEESVGALYSDNLERVGELMNMSQGLLDAIGVNTLEAHTLVYAARKAGALGAKMTGGGGDNIIALALPESQPAIEEALTNAGGKNIERIIIAKEGVVIE